MDSDVASRILDQATQIFGRQGYGAASMREIAEASGVTKPTIYYWFQSKEGLFLAAIERQLESLRSLLREVLTLSAGPEERLAVLCRRYIADGVADPDGVRLFLMAEGPREEGRPDIDLLEIHNESLAAIQSLLADGVTSGIWRSDLDPAVASLALLGMLNMQILAALHGMSVPEDLPDQMLRIYLRGVTV